MPSKKPARKPAKKKPVKKPVKKTAKKAVKKAKKKVTPKVAKKPARRTAKKPPRKPDMGTKKPASKKAKAPGKLTTRAVKKAAITPPADVDSFTISTKPLKKGKVGGRLEMSKTVVAVIANYTARRVKGIHALGKAGLLYRSIGADPTRGVDAEVGEKQAALDLEVVIEYGCDINATIEELRQQIAQEVYKTAGREVVEINIKVTGINIEG